MKISGPWPIYVGVFVAAFPVVLYFFYDLAWPLLAMIAVMVIAAVIQVVVQSVSYLKNRHARR